MIKITIDDAARTRLVEKIQELAGYHIGPSGLDHRGAGHVLDEVLGQLGIEVDEVQPIEPDDIEDAVARAGYRGAILYNGERADALTEFMSVVECRPEVEPDGSKSCFFDGIEAHVLSRTFGPHWKLQFGGKRALSWTGTPTPVLGGGWKFLDIQFEDAS
jgi:hypothetical protein